MELQALKSLDLRACNTVSEIIDAMCFCSFGARMLGEMVKTWEEWVRKEEAPVVIFNGKSHTALDDLLIEMQRRKMIWDYGYGNADCSYLKDPEFCGYGKRNVIVIGHFSEDREEMFYSLPQERVIFINEIGQCRPGQVKDGYYPDVVFSDPRYVLPIISACLEERIENKPISVSDFFASLGRYEGLAREVAHGGYTLKKMVEDPDCTVFLTLSGAMTIAKMSLVICEMIDTGMVQFISSTGALMGHGLIESLGLKHFKYNPDVSDEELAEQLLNRVTDTLEPESNFDMLDTVLGEIFDRFQMLVPTSPSAFLREVGSYLNEKFPNERGILTSAFLKNVPVLVPAWTDSEVGNDMYVENFLRRKKGLPKISMDLELDTELLVSKATSAKRLGIFSIGGGVPRNNTQNVAPLIEIINGRTDANLPVKQFRFGCKICPDKHWFGHLSGCTYQEGMSWRKMDFDGQFAEVHTDATIVFPLLVKFVMEQLGL